MSVIKGETIVDLWMLWLVAGFVLVIAELVTGTFYLLVIGVGAFAGAVVAWTGAHAIVQAFVASIVALAGVWAVHHWHSRNRPGRTGDNLLDRGQPVVLESWANEAAGIARVRYRGTSWDARVAPGERPLPGTTLYISGQQGNELVVESSPPAA